MPTLQVEVVDVYTSETNAYLPSPFIRNIQCSGSIKLRVSVPALTPRSKMVLNSKYGHSCWLIGK